MDDQCYNNNGYCGEHMLRYTQYNGNQCRCLAGFELDLSGYCVDIDECAVGSFSCSGENEKCENRLGNMGLYRHVAGLMHDDISCPDQCSHGCDNPQSMFESSFSFSSLYSLSPSKPPQTGCSCPTGYQLDQNGYDCVDVDECFAGAHACTHICFNFDGSFTCLCPEGQELDSDNRKSVQMYFKQLILNRDKKLKFLKQNESYVFLYVKIRVRMSLDFRRSRSDHDHKI